jgi:iron complex outermembrane receptor protein
MSLPARYDDPPVRQVRPQSRQGRRFWAGFYVLVLIALAAASWAAEIHPTAATILELKQLSLEELLDVEVTSVSRKEEKLFEAAAAVYVITQSLLKRTSAVPAPPVFPRHCATFPALTWLA